MKVRIYLLPAALVCAALAFSCDDSSQKSSVNPGSLRSGLYTGTSVFSVAGSSYSGSTTLELTVSGASASGTVESDYDQPVGTQTGDLTGTSLGGGYYSTTLVTSSSTATGTSFVSEDNVIDGSVSGTYNGVSFTITFTLTGQNMDDGGGDDGGSGTDDPGQTSFITWNGSANGQYVIDASGDFVRFSTEGYLYIGTIKITNCYVSGYNVVWNGSTIGVVAGILSTSSNCIAALVNDNEYGSMIDIYGSNPYYWQYSAFDYCGCDGGCGSEYDWDLGPLDQG